MPSLPTARTSLFLWAAFFLALSGLLLLRGHAGLGERLLLLQLPRAGHRGPARPLSAAELMARPPPEDLGRIPKLFHQSWRSHELPAKFQRWSATCRELHPEWEWVLWTDEDNAKLVETHFPWLVESYRALPAEIYRADLARLMYMYSFGGLYVDLDTECLQPSEVILDEYKRPTHSHVPLRPSQRAFFGRMGSFPDFPHSIPNAWMAATPGHPFFLVYLDKVDRHVRWGIKPGIAADVVTGPQALREAIARYEYAKVMHGNIIDDRIVELRKSMLVAYWEFADHQVILLPSDLVYPYSWWHDGDEVKDICWVTLDGFDSEKCKTLLQVEERGSITITYWSHSYSATENITEETIMEHISS